jgi:hypothetical protein
METISNIASTATSTVSNLIYGNQDTATKTNETAGKEPVSGLTGKGTVDEPYDQGNSGEFNIEKQRPLTTAHADSSSQKSLSTRTPPPAPAQALSPRRSQNPLAPSRSPRISSRPTATRLAMRPPPPPPAQAPAPQASQTRPA